jgi:hypothetical protein
MNVLSEVETPDGTAALALTPAEAQARIEQLRGVLQKLDVQRSSVESEIRALGLIANPETAYGDHYTPRGHMPAWTP